MHMSMEFVNNNQNLVGAISLTVALLLICMLVGHLFHTNKWVNESITSLILGLCAGAVVFVTTKGQNSHILQFDEDLFFYYLLPPIIFNAGFQVKKKQFFQNFATIMLFGVIGVFISFTVITIACRTMFPRLGLELSFIEFMALGVIFSATDSVCTLQVLHQDETPLLYSLVFGEGVMNDASSVVLFNAIQDLDLSEVDFMKILVLLWKFLYLFVTSTILGISAGLISALIIKKMYVGRHSTDREFAIMVLIPYLSYMLAELLQLSGILTVFFCGIVMSHYTWYNVTEGSRTTTRHTFATMSFIAETFIFLYVGMDALDKEKWKMTNVSPGTSLALSGTLLASVLVGRAAFVFPLSVLSNLTGRTERFRISFRHQVIIWWAGLMRGAVSIALAYHQFTVFGRTTYPIHAVLITSTIIVVVFSTVVFGMLTKPLVLWIQLPHHVRSTWPSDSRQSSPTKSLLNEYGLDASLLGNSSPNNNNDIENFATRSSSLHMLLTAPTYTVHYLWRKFDDAYMRPIFGGRLAAAAAPPELQPPQTNIINNEHHNHHHPFQHSYSRQQLPQNDLPRFV